MARAEILLVALASIALPVIATAQQRYTGADGRVRIPLARQPFSPTGISEGPNTMANGGIQKILGDMGATICTADAALSPAEEMIFTRYPKASAIGFATIPSTDEGGLSIAAVNRMIAGAVKGVIARERR